MCHCNERGSEVILGDKSHIAVYEQGNVAQLAGIFPRILPNLSNGTLDFNQLVAVINLGTDVHACKTKLICLENTHNKCGGKILPIEFLQNVSVKLLMSTSVCICIYVSCKHVLLKTTGKYFLILFLAIFFTQGYMFKIKNNH